IEVAPVGVPGAVPEIRLVPGDGQARREEDVKKRRGEKNERIARQRVCEDSRAIAPMDGRSLTHTSQPPAVRRPTRSQPASNGRPEESMSITRGAWSDGVGLPFRASRSISDQISRGTRGDVTSR